jgi:predicted nucleic acid-binding protein
MGKRYLIDTNIVRKYLEEDLTIDGLDLIDFIINSQNSYISVINRIELLGYNPIEVSTSSFLIKFIELSIEFSLSESIVLKTISLRKIYKIKLPDAIIAATAIVNDLILLSDNDSYFGKISNLRYINPRKYIKQ